MTAGELYACSWHILVYREFGEEHSGLHLEKVGRANYRDTSRPGQAVQKTRRNTWGCLSSAVDVFQKMKLAKGEGHPEGKEPGTVRQDGLKMGEEKPAGRQGIKNHHEGDQQVRKEVGGGKG